MVISIMYKRIRFPDSSSFAIVRDSNFSRSAALPNIEVLIDTLTNDVVERRQSLDDALFALQSWFDKNVELMDADERISFSNRLNAEKDAAQRDGRPHGDDASLVASVLRLHIMRLLYRYDERQQPG